MTIKTKKTLKKTPPLINCEIVSSDKIAVLLVVIDPYSVECMNERGESIGRI